MRRALAMALVLLLLVAGQASAQIAYYPPGPTGTIGVSRPRLGMRVQASDQDKVLKATVTVDGKAYPALVEGDLFYYQPEVPLTPGPHSISINIVLSGDYRPLTRSWQVTVAPEALAELPPPTPTQVVALNAVNAYRRLADLGPVVLDPALNAAAQAHARYYILNPTRGLSAHYEQPGNTGFTGVAPWDRGAYFGYQTAGSYEEDMDFVEDHEQAVRDWMDSVYHRFLITNPDLTAVGYGFATDNSDNYANVLQGGARLPDLPPDEVQVVAYPMPGQREVPLAWDDREVPDPLRFWGAKTSGYPITLQFSAAGMNRLEVNATSLLDSSGASVPLWTITPQNDEHLKHQVALMAQQSLKAGVRYTASVSGAVYREDGSSRPFTKTWWFTTQSAAASVYANAGITVRLNGLPMSFDVPPALENNRTMVPFRAVFEALGASVVWDPGRYAVLAGTARQSIRLKIGNDRALVDGKDVLLDAPPLILGDRTLVPLRFVAETLGLKVGWDEKTRTVTLVGP